jgi:hypothetical protein
MPIRYGVIASLVFLAAATSPPRLAAATLKERLTEVILPLVKTAPKIDGVIREEEWRDACRVVGFMRTATWIEYRDGVFWLACDGRKLYLAVRSEVHPQAGILADATPSASDADLTKDDTVELWLDPRKGAADGDRKYYQIIVNHHGALNDASFLDDKKDASWRVQWEFASKVENGWWQLEVAIPLSSLGVSPEDLTTAWGMRIMRNWKKPDWQTDWVMQGYDWERHPYSDRNTMATVGWREEGVVTRVLSLQAAEGKGAQLSVELRNLSAREQVVKADIQFQSEGKPPQAFKEELALKAQEARVVTLGDETAKGECAANLKVTSGENDIFYRSFRFFAQKRKDRWWVDPDPTRTPEFDLAYYPYYNRLKARLIIKELKDAKRVRGAAITINDQTGASLAKADFRTLKDGVTELIMAVPELSDGTYTAQAVLRIKDGKDIEVRQDFQRTKYDWERNTIGFTDKVVPPFTPIKVEGSEVSVVLRKHQVGQAGLWDQVLSEGIPILASPMRFDVKVGGKRYKTEVVREVSFTAQQENLVKFSSAWKAGPLTVKANGYYEMDGMMRVELVLNQVGSEAVESFDLVIPLKAEIATLMNAYSTVERSNLSGAIPQGEGVVWESSKAQHEEKADPKGRAKFPGTFIPYLWLGNERQGMCWFAENDKDWLVDDIGSTHEVQRREGAVRLRVHFITKPGALKRERRLVFGLQATPTKPMPMGDAKGTNWRRWMTLPPNDYAAWTKTSDDANAMLVYNILDACFYGRGGHFSSIYPAHKNEAAYALAGEAHRQGTFDRTRLFADFQPNPQILRSEEDLAIAAFAWHLEEQLKIKIPCLWMPYCNPRGADFTAEFLTFQDEWLRFDYSGREWSADSLLQLSRSRAKVVAGDVGQRGVFYDVKPVRSYQDYCLWWWKKMLEKGAADGIYFDNTFLVVNHDVVGGTAYYDEEGKVRQGVDTLALRELLKRSWVLCSELGMPMINLAHMSGSPTMPVNTWAAINLDWEEQFTTDDYQDKFARDLIRTQSIGLQSGSVPLVLNQARESWGVKVRNLALSDWIMRTLLGVTLVHELGMWDGPGVIPPSSMLLNYRTRYVLSDFGYGLQDCEVWTYWQKDCPVAVKGVDAEGLVLKRGGQALIVVTSFGKGGEADVQLDGQRLGLRPGESYYDLETGDKLEASGQFGCKFRLPRHDFKVIGRAGVPVEGAKGNSFTRGLALLEDASAIPAKTLETMSSALQDRSIMVRRLARKALARQGKAAQGAWRVALSDSDPETRSLALSGLYEIGEPVDAELKAAFRDGDSQYRALLAQALLRCGPRAAEVLRGELKNAEVETRMTVLKGLGDLGLLTMTELREALQDESFYVRKFAVQVIGDRFRSAAAEKILATLATDDKDPIVKRAAEMMLKEFSRDTSFVHAAAPGR